MASKRLKLISYILAALVLIVAIIAYLGSSKPVKVIIKPVERGLVQDTVANTRAGTIKACHRAGLSPSLGGQIAKLPVKVGDKVKAGQILMELWNEDRLAQVTLAKREAKSATALASQACIKADVADREAKRLRKLRLKGLATEEAIDKADGEALAQKAACTAAKANAEVSEARLDVARALLDQTRLTAPFDGIVAEINGEVGEFVTPSPVGIPTPPAVDLVDITCLYVSAPIDEVDAPAIRVGMPAKISLDAFPKQIFRGKVKRIAPYVLDIEKQARTVDVEVNFANAKDSHNMLPGYSADIEVILAEHPDAIRIPTEAILEGNRVLRLEDDGILHEQHIKTGLSNWEFTEVLDGLKENDRIVVSVDRDGVKDGAHAEPE
ncbi:MAG: efflux RND transporter periplasmic adaptor subunit, partial [Thiohalomonadales bacterium]|nr:efflux RND transporter periplasmic adaptor subunit [Thiohalomonadales bacterium]